jgi:hypothetical protein
MIIGRARGLSMPPRETGVTLDWLRRAEDLP